MVDEMRERAGRTALRHRCNAFSTCHLTLQKGRHNRQARLVSLATAVTETHMSVIHSAFPGNENASRCFRNSVDSMIETLGKLGAKCNDLCFVFDKGVNS